MKTAIIYGEFIGKSSTGIAYVNTNLKEVLKELGYEIKTFDEPRSNEYSSNSGTIKRKPNLFLFAKLIFSILTNKKNDISFITISMSNLGLIKTFLIQSLLVKKSCKLYLYIHRGDLSDHYKKSYFKKFIINKILKKSFKIILLSNKFINSLSLKNFRNKVLVIPNSLSRKDCEISYQIYKDKLSSYKCNPKIINFIFSGNIQKEKGIHNIITSIKNYNKISGPYKIKLDIYGMKFEEIGYSDNYINYKGKLKNDIRLEVMSKYDFFISASISEGLPITLIECMAIGLPFITTKVGAVEDLLIDNYPYVTNSDSESIMLNINKALRDLIENRIFINNLISSNNNLFQIKFKYENYFNCIKKLLDE